MDKPLFMWDNMGVVNLHISKIGNDEARSLIEKNHYSHTWTICELALGVYDDSTTETFFDVPKTLGVVVFGPVSGAQVAESISPLLNHENLWELKRLWCDDCLGKNTESWVISKSIEYVRKHHPHILCIVSYADKELHDGTVYQATNFLYQDIERPAGTSGYVVSFDDGKTWIHGRTLFNQYGTFDRDELVKELPRPFLIKELSTKHRYLMPLGNKMWRRKLLKSLNYPLSSYPKGKVRKEVISRYDV